MRTPGAIALGLSLLAAADAAPARAQQAGGGPASLREALVNLDGNGDMAIEEDEVPEAALAAFERLLKRGDANKNGKLEFDELRALGEKLRTLGIGPDSTPAERFRAMDEDGDGKVSKDEFLGPEPLFARIDADGDGFLTRPEMTRFAAANAPTPGRLRAMDKDGDGKVSREEFTGPAPQFARLDADKDGFITEEEAAKVLGARATPDESKPDVPKAKTKAKGQGKAAALLERLRAMDRDGDGKISKEEFKGRPAMFDRLDADKDGYLSRDELRPGRAQAKKKREKE